MNIKPTIEQAALATARYAANELTALSSWVTYEDELAAEWLKDPMFVCTIEYTIAKVMENIRWSKQMQGIAAQHGGGARGVARVVGMIVGEWVGGHTTIDREIQSWG